MTSDYGKYINALRKCAKEHEKDFTPPFNIRVADLCNDTATLLEALEQEPNECKAEERYCDRNICIQNEYNGIDCENCIVKEQSE